MKLYWRIKKNGKWTWVAAKISDEIGPQSYVRESHQKK